MERYSEPPADGTPTVAAVQGHPLHPMLVAFPIAFLLATLATDAGFLLTGDEFWARVSLWLLGAGFTMGAVAGVTGTVELLAVRGIRQRAAGWSHFIAAVMLLSVAFANWLLRIGDPVGIIWPWGAYLSALGALLVAIAGWLGGNLVFEHQVGIVDDDGD